MTPKLLALAKVCSVLGNICDVSRGICQSVGVSSRKGEHFPFWTKMVHTKIKPALDVKCSGGEETGKLERSALTLFQF